MLAADSKTPRRIARWLAIGRAWTGSASIVDLVEGEGETRKNTDRHGFKEKHGRHGSTRTPRITPRRNHRDVPLACGMWSTIRWLDQRTHALRAWPVVDPCPSVFFRVSPGSVTFRVLPVSFQEAPRNSTS